MTSLSGCIWNSEEERFFLCFYVSVVGSVFVSDEEEITTEAQKHRSSNYEHVCETHILWPSFADFRYCKTVRAEPKRLP